MFCFQEFSSFMSPTLQSFVCQACHCCRWWRLLFIMLDTEKSDYIVVTHHQLQTSRLTIDFKTVGDCPRIFKRQQQESKYPRRFSFWSEMRIGQNWHRLKSYSKFVVTGERVRILAQCLRSGICPSKALRNGTFFSKRVNFFLLGCFLF